MTILTIVLTSFGLIYVLLQIKYNSLEKEIKSKTNGIPCVDFSTLIPLIGDLGMITNYPYFQRRNHAKYGDIFATLFLGDVFIAISSPELFDQIYIKNAKNIDTDWNAAARELLGESGFLSISGDVHKRYRKIYLSHLGAPVLNHLFPRFVNVFDKYVKKWIEKTKDGSYIDIVGEVQNAIWDVMATVMLGDDFPVEDSKELSKLFLAYGNGLLVLPINLPFTAYRKALEAREKIKEILIKEFKRRQTMPNNGADRKDVFQTIVNETSGEGFKEGFNLDICYGTTWASLDTTKSSTLQVINCMFDHEKEWDKIREDVEKVYGSEGLLAPEATYSTTEKEIPYLSACSKEAMRITDVAFFTMRKVESDLQVQSNGKTYIIPKGYKVYGSFGSNMKNPESKVFSNVTSFIPERFLGDNAEDKISNYKSTLTYFGTGERSCVGYNVAKLEIEVLIALMSKYKWIRRERPESWYCSPLALPEGGLWIRYVSPRTKN